MLKFHKPAVYFPDLKRSRPQVTDQERAIGSETPPHIVPYQCKPWTDGQLAGWSVPYGFLTSVTIVGLGEGRIEVENLKQLRAELNFPVDPILNFAPGYFSLGTAYSLLTPAGMVTLTMPPTYPAGPNFSPLPSVVETDWFPRTLFLVYRALPKGQRLTLDYGLELARIVVIPRQDGLKAEPMSDEELTQLDEREKGYRQTERQPENRWQSASGLEFSHTYRIWSRRYSHGEIPPSWP